MKNAVLADNNCYSYFKKIFAYTVNINIELTNNIPHLPPRSPPLSAKILKLWWFLQVKTFFKNRKYFLSKKLLEKCKFMGPLNVVGPRASARSASSLNPPLPIHLRNY